MANADTTTPGSRSEDPTNPWERYGWLVAAVWLVFLFFPAQALVITPAPLLPRLIGWVALILFAVVYFAGFVIGMRAGFGHATPRGVTFFCGLTLCVLATVPAIGWAATSFLPFLMAFASYGLNLIWHWCVTIASLLIIGTLIVLAVPQGVEPPWMLAGIIGLMAVINSIMIMLLNRTFATDHLRLEIATRREREAVARDVHDLLGHTLTVIKLKTELASRMLDTDPERTRTELDEITLLTAEAITGVRTTVTGLRDDGLRTQLDEGRRALTAAGLSVDVLGEPEALSPAQSLTAAWVLREATTNVLRHARATHVTVSFAPGTVAITDNGVGLPPDATPGAATASSGSGRWSMSERAASAGAQLRVGTAPDGHGTEVKLTW